MANFFKKYRDEFLSFGTSADMTVQENAKISRMNIGFIIFSAITFLYSFFYIIEDSINNTLLISLGISTLLFFLPLFSYFKKHRIGWHIGIMLFIVGITLTAIQRPTLYVNYLLYTPIPFLIVYLFDKNKWMQFTYLVFITLNIISFTALIYENNGEGNMTNLLFSFILIGVIFSFQNYLISIFKKEKQKIENEFAKAISLKEAALNANKDAILITNVNGEVTDWNIYYLIMWNFEEENMASLSLSKFLKKLKLELAEPWVLREIIESAAQNPLVCTFDRVYLKDGKIINCYSMPQILDGKLVGRVYNYKDVTLKYQNEKLKIESENRLRSVMKDSPFGIVILDDNNNPFQNVNQQLCDMLGYTKQELSQMELKDLCAPEYLDTHIKEYTNLKLSGADNFTLINKYKKKNNDTFWGKLHVSIRKNEDNAIQNVIIMLENVDEKIKQEKKIKQLVRELTELNENLGKTVELRTYDLREMNKELRRSNRDLEQFTYIASHDLQEPLRMIGNFVQLLERQYKDQIDNEGKEYIKFIVDGVTRMSKLIRNLLKYSRVGRKEAELRLTKLDRIIEAKLFGLQRLIEEKNARLIIGDIPSDIYCEPNQIGMVFYNLITNALKFNTGSPVIEVGCEEKGNCYQFFVQDNGIGIDDIYRNKVFEIFKRLHRKEEYEGTGIGLALCKKIILRHGGEIWFDSEPNKGTTFYFSISKSLKNEKQIPFNTNLVS